MEGPKDSKECKSYSVSLGSILVSLTKRKA